MTLSFRALLCAGGAMLLAPHAFAQEVRVAPSPGIASAPAGAVKGKAADAASALPSGGAPVTADQASATEAQLKAWIAAMVGPTLKIDRPVRLTPAGDHFDVLVPIQLGTPGQSLSVTATARPLDGGKWAVAGIRAALPATFTITMPVPDKDNDAKPKMGPVTYTVTAGAQDGSATIDPSFATPSTWTTSSKDVTVRSTGGSMAQNSTIGATQSVTTLIPAGPDRVDLRTEGTMTAYAVSSPANGDTPAIKIGIDTLRVSAAMDGVNRSRSMELTQALTTMFMAVLASPSGQAPDISPKTVNTILTSMLDFAHGMEMEEDLEGLSFAFGDNAMNLDQGKFGMTASSDKGILQAGMTLEAAGVELPNLQLGPMEALIPQRIAFKPFISGLGVAEASRMLSAFSEGKDPAPEDLDAMFSHGGIVSGLESMLVEVGGATFEGQVKMTATDLQTFKGGGQIRIENFDTLFKKVSSMPMLQQGVPVMILLKGIGKTVNNKLVYDITYDGAKVLVNDVDLMAMAGGGAAPPPDEGPKKAPVRPRQQPAPQNRTR